MLFLLKKYIYNDTVVSGYVLKVYSRKIFRDRGIKFMLTERHNIDC